MEEADENLFRNITHFSPSSPPFPFTQRKSTLLQFETTILQLYHNNRKFIYIMLFRNGYNLSQYRFLYPS